MHLSFLLPLLGIAAFAVYKIVSIISAKWQNAGEYQMNLCVRSSGPAIANPLHLSQPKLDNSAASPRPNCPTKAFWDTNT